MFKSLYIAFDNDFKFIKYNYNFNFIQMKNNF